MRYPASEKLEIIRIVEQSHLPAKRTLDQLGITRRTFYRWYDRYLEGGLEALADRPSAPSRVWNRIPDTIHDQIIELALEQSELSPRESVSHHQTARKDQATDHRTSALATPQARRLKPIPRRGPHSAKLRRELCQMF
jgi:transposase-like protein